MIYQLINNLITSDFKVGGSYINSAFKVIPLGSLSYKSYYLSLFLTNPDLLKYISSLGRSTYSYNRNISILVPFE